MADSQCFLQYLGRQFGIIRQFKQLRIQSRLRRDNHRMFSESNSLF